MILKYLFLVTSLVHQFLRFNILIDGSHGILWLKGLSLPRPVVLAWAGSLCCEGLPRLPLRGGSVLSCILDFTRFVVYIVDMVCVLQLHNIASILLWLRGSTL